MGPQARDEYLAQLRDRYVRATRTEKGRMLTEAEAVTGYYRKAVIRAWRRCRLASAPGAVRPSDRPRRFAICANSALVPHFAITHTSRPPGHPASLRCSSLSYAQ